MSPASSPADTDTHAPSLPTNILLTAVTQTSVDVTWTASTDDVGVAGYRVYTYKTVVGSTPTTRVSVVGLSCGTTYTVGIEAYDAAGNSSARATVLAATSPCYDAQPPSPPDGLTQVASTDTSATISWRASTDNVGVVGYHAYLGGVEIGRTSETSYTFAGLACGRSTTISIDAYDAAGNRSTQTAYIVATSRCGDTHAPSPPTGISLTGSTEQSVSIAWTAARDDVGVAGYAVLLDGAQVGSTAQTSYTIPGLTCGTSYTVGVAAYDAAGNRSAPATVLVSTSRCTPSPPPTGSDEKPPSVPANLAVTSTTETSVTLVWAPSTDNVGVSGYGIYEGDVLIDQTTLPSYALTGLQCGTSTSVAVDAYDAAGNRSAQAVAIVSTSPCSDTAPPAPPTSLTLSARTATSISVTWAPSTDHNGVAGYDVYRGGAKVGSTSATTYTLTGLACGTGYTIGVAAYDGSGNRSTQTTAMLSTTACGDTQPPSAPTGLKSSSPTATSLSLSWTASTDNVGVAGYDVFANGTKAGSTQEASYTLNGLSCGKSYTLGVEAFDESGNRSSRATVSAQTSACSGGTGTAGLYVSPSGNDANPCLQASPCASLNRAYQLALPGQTVEVAGGTYPGQVIQSRAAMRNLSPGCTPGWTQNCVTFRPAAGQSVQINGALEVHGSGVYVDGSPGQGYSGVPTRGRSYSWKVSGYTDTEGDSSSVYPDHVVFAGIDTTSFGAFGVDTVTYENMDVGPGTISSGCAIREGPGIENKIGFGGGVTVVPKNVTIDGLLIHNQNGDAGRGDCHFGGLFLVTVDGLTIRNSVFSQNVVYNIQIQNFGGAPAPANVTIENNWFGCPVEWLYTSDTQCDNQPDIQFNAASSFSNYLIRDNSFVSGIGEYVPGASFSNVTVASNAGGAPSECYAGMSFRYNAWKGSGCSSTDKSLPSLPFVASGAGSEDLHLVAGSPAIDAGDPPDSASTDIDGDPRPLGPAPDAGADEKS